MKTALLIVLIFITACSQNRYPESDHYDGNKFFNPEGPGPRSFTDFLKWMWTREAAEWPENIPNSNYKLPLLGAGKGIVTFINHATFLVQLQGLTFLTDPIFSKRAGPFESFGPVKRVREPGVEIELLPAVDVVLISHNHYDHMDMESLKALDSKFRPLFLVPLGEEKRLKEAGLHNVHEMDWWDVKVLKGASIIFTPVLHWSSRGLLDKNRSLWGGYFVDHASVKIYFAGDTGYTPYFEQTKQRLGLPDIAMFPIGAYEPRWFMKDYHMNPEEAVKAHLDIESKLSFGMHFGTFQLTDEAYAQPIIDLKAAREKRGVDPKKFRVLDFGESYMLQGH